MGEDLKLFMGECFIDVTEDEATAKHEVLADEKREEVDRLSDQIDSIESEMKDLKSYLYARFGKSINLEED